MINPVQKVITIMRYEATFESFGAGESALSQVSELNPPRIEECAIYKGEEVIEQLEIVDARYEDLDDCMKVQLWKYNLSYFARDVLLIFGEHRMEYLTTAEFVKKANRF